MVSYVWLCSVCVTGCDVEGILGYTWGILNVNEWIYLGSRYASMVKFVRHMLDSSLKIRHNLFSSKVPKPRKRKKWINDKPKTRNVTLAVRTSKRQRTNMESASKR